MSLVMVICAVADFVESAALVAVTARVAGEGKSGGAVNAPVAVIVPVAALPPGTPFTAQVTFVFAVFMTVAVNVCELPNKTDVVVGETDTLIAGGGGGGGGCTVPPPGAQPAEITLAPTTKRNGNGARRARATRLDLLCLFADCVRGRMPGRMQAKGQRKGASGVAGLAAGESTHSSLRFLFAVD